MHFYHVVKRVTIKYDPRVTDVDLFASRPIIKKYK